LADIYQVETRRLNEAVKRNIKRFPSDFMLRLTNQEFEILMSQFVTSSWGGTCKLPFFFIVYIEYFCIFAPSFKSKIMDLQPI